MGRSSDIEAFARLLEGAPASSVPASVAILGRTVSALHAIPAPALPASLAGAGGVALLARAGVDGTRIAATHAATGAATQATIGGTRIAATHAVGKTAAAKAGLMGIITAHLAPVVAGTALVAVGVTGVAVGASRSLPGDPLYGLKRATETLQTATVSGQVPLAERRLDLATTRLQEALALQQRGGSQAALTTELHEWLADEAAALKVLAPLAGTPAVRAKLVSFAAANATGLAAFPAAVVAPATAAVKTVTTLLTPVVAGIPKPGTPAVVLPSGLPRLPSAVASLLPTHPRTTTPTHLPTPVVSLPAVHAKPPVKAVPSAATLPSVVTTAPAAGLPTLVPGGNPLPTAVLPSAALPTALPTALPSLPDVTTLLQNVLPKH